MPKKKKESKLPLIFFILSLALSLFIVKMAIFDQGGVKDLYRLSDRVLKQKKENLKLKKNNLKLEEQIVSLKNNSFYFEKIVREELGYVKKGEIVFEFIK